MAKRPEAGRLIITPRWQQLALAFILITFVATLNGLQKTMKLCTSRSKLVTFRLTDEEFDAIRDLCISKGFRSISELTRKSLLQQLSEERDPGTSVVSDLVTLLTGLQGLDTALKDLRDQIAVVLGPGSTHNSTVAPNKNSTAKGAAK